MIKNNLTLNNQSNERNAILEIQFYLNNISRDHSEIPTVTNTGIYDNKTREAVSIFQKMLGLPVTGRVNFNTWKALVRENHIHAYKKEAPLKIPCNSIYFTEIKTGYKGDIVYIIKIILNKFNRRFANYSNLDITNIYDSHTENAIKQFQKSSMLPVTGIVDKTTWNTLVSIYDTCKLYN